MQTLSTRWCQIFCLKPERTLEKCPYFVGLPKEILLLSEKNKGFSLSKNWLIRQKERARIGKCILKIDKKCQKGKKTWLKVINNSSKIDPKQSKLLQI